MSIRQITKEQLRRMGDKEGLVLQGCGGDPQEWLDGIHEILTNEGIDCAAFDGGDVPEPCGLRREERIRY